jgi:plasmid stability protein
MSERTTLTLEDDVAAQLRDEARRQGRSLKAVANDALRTGLRTTNPEGSVAFRIRVRDMGLRPGIDLDDIQALLDQLDGTSTR